MVNLSVESSTEGRLISGKLKTLGVVDIVDPKDAPSVVKARVGIFGVEFCNNVDPGKAGNTVESVIIG